MCDMSQKENDVMSPPGRAVDMSSDISVLRRRTNALAHTTIDRYVEASGLYTPETVPEHLYRDSLHTIRRFMDTALLALGDPGLDVPEILRDELARANDRAAEGVPLRNFLHCWQIGADTLIEAVEEQLGEPSRSAPVVVRIRATYDAVIREAISAYERTSRDTITAHTGWSSRWIAHFFDGAVSPHDDYPGEVPEDPVVVLIHIGATVAETTGSDQVRTIAGTRKARRTRALLQRRLGERLWLADVREQSARLITSSVPSELATAVEKLQEVHSVPVAAAVARAERPEDLRRAAQEASEVLEVAVQINRTGCVTSLADVALEHHLAHHSMSLAVLQRRCAPVRANEELLETLNVYFKTDLDRRQTSEALHVHPNTIDNRLAKIRQLTGLDSRHLPDLMILAVGVKYAVP